jgi:hypothetical protein
LGCLHLLKQVYKAQATFGQNFDILKVLEQVTNEVTCSLVVQILYLFLEVPAEYPSYLAKDIVTSPKLVSAIVWGLSDRDSAKGSLDILYLFVTNFPFADS